MALTSYLARSIISLAVDILPERRSKEWPDAMLAEFLAIDHPPEALAFAAGCLRASIVERNFAMTVPHRLLFLAALAIPVGLAAIALTSAANLASINGSIAALFALLGIVYVGVAVWTVLRNHRALITASTVALALCVVSFAVLSLPLSLEHNTLFQALVTESMVIWLILLGLGVGLRRLSEGHPA